MFDFRKLIKLLEKELNYQEKLLELLTRERVAIVKLNQDQLDEIQEVKQGILNEVVDIEQRRQEIFTKLAEQSQREEPLKFSEVVELCPPGEGRGPLQHVGQNLKKVAESVRELNAENGVLIKQSLGLIATTLAIMRAAPEADLPTYTPSGTLSEKAEEPGFVSQKRQLSKEA